MAASSDVAVREDVEKTLRQLAAQMGVVPQEEKVAGFVDLMTKKLNVASLRSKVRHHRSGLRSRATDKAGFTDIYNTLSQQKLHRLDHVVSLIDQLVTEKPLRSFIAKASGKPSSSRAASSSSRSTSVPLASSPTPSPSRRPPQHSPVRPTSGGRTSEPASPASSDDDIPDAPVGRTPITSSSRVRSTPTTKKGLKPSFSQQSLRLKGTPQGTSVVLSGAALAKLSSTDSLTTPADVLSKRRAKSSKRATSSSAQQPPRSGMSMIGQRGGIMKKRPPEDRDLLDLRYGDVVSLVARNGKHLSLVPRTRRGSSSDVTYVVRLVEREEADHFTIINPQAPKDRSAVHFQDVVALGGAKGTLLAADPDGGVSVIHKFHDRAKWTMFTAPRPQKELLNKLGRPIRVPSSQRYRKVEGVIKLFDDVVFKSAYDTFLGPDTNLTADSLSGNAPLESKDNDVRRVNSRSPDAEQDQVWTVRRAYLPMVPEWARTRPIELSKPRPKPRPRSHMRAEREQRRQLIEDEQFEYDDLDELIEEETSSDSDYSDGDPSKPMTPWHRWKMQLRSLNQLPTVVQEQVLLEDVLFVLMGVEGKYIHLHFDKEDQPHFELPKQVKDSSISYIVKRILPLCGHHYAVNHFVDIHSRFEYGLVSHALCTAIRLILKEYLILIAQLEHQYRKGKLTLQRVWFYVQPSLHTMERLHRVSRRAHQHTGGALLNVIYTIMMKEGDPTARALYVHLLSRAAVPYLAVLEQWIYQGLIDDPYHEFQIKERKDIRKEQLTDEAIQADKFWQDKYTVRDDMLPVFLSKSSERILVTGKYLNVIRESGLAINCPFQDQIQFTSDEREYSELVDRAYQFASRQLLDLLLRKERLMTRLYSIKRYFLIDQGDFFLHFLDMAQEELSQKSQLVSVSKLDSLLELALRTSTTSLGDPFMDDVACQIHPMKLEQQIAGIQRTGTIKHKDETKHSGHKTQLDGFEAFSFRYEVKWPLSLIITSDALVKYQIIFRHLFFCKWVEQRLCSAWLDHQSTKELNVRSVMAETYALRQRMLHFLQNVAYYIMVEVLEPNWHTMAQKLQEANTVDEVIRHHATFLHNCLRECLLTNPDLLKNLYKALTVCITFADFSSNQIGRRLAPEEDLLGLSQRRTIGRGLSAHARRQARIAEEASDMRKTMASHDTQRSVRHTQQLFDDRLMEFLSQLQDKSAAQYDHHLANLATRIDFNGFYSDMLAKRRAKQRQKMLRKSVSRSGYVSNSRADY